jgi:hypothetical protein
LVTLAASVALADVREFVSTPDLLAEMEALSEAEVLLCAATEVCDKAVPAIRVLRMHEATINFI